MRGFSVKHKFPKYKTIFKFNQMPKSRVTAVMGRLFLSKLRLSTKFSRFCWQNPIFTFLLFARNFGVLFSIIYFLFLQFYVKKSSFCFSNFCWQIPIFTLLLFKFLLFTSVFRLSIVRFQLSDFCWRFQFSRFCIVNFLRKQMLIF
jgi:hypothetical protein